MLLARVFRACALDLKDESIEVIDGLGARRVSGQDDVPTSIELR